VAARDGTLGHVGELVLNPETGHISHLVLEEGHLWAKKEVAVPVSAIDYLLEDTVYLKLDKREVESLPTVQVKRHA
jgi:sporulation protein YlmC with PRC-barrel domain